MQNSVSATEARVHFGAIMQDVLRSQQAVVVEKAGKPQVVILSYDRYQQLINENTADWQAMLAEGHALVNAWLAGRELSNPVEMVEEGRRIRNEELTNLR